MKSNVSSQVRTHAFSYGNLVCRFNNGYIPFTHRSFDLARNSSCSKRNHGVEYGLCRSCWILHKMLWKSELRASSRDFKIRHTFTYSQYDRLFRQKHSNENSTATPQCVCTFGLRARLLPKHSTGRSEHLHDVEFRNQLRVGQNKIWKTFDCCCSNC